MTATDWSTGEPRVVRMPLNPARGAEEQLATLFKRARRLKAGARVARARLDAAEAARSTLLAISARLTAPNAIGPPDIDALEREAHDAAPHDFRRHPIGASPTATHHATPSALPGEARGGPRSPPLVDCFRCFAANGGGRILVGRTGSHNDELTFHVGRPHDLWLHAKSRAGAHVIVPLDRGKNCPSNLLIEAAHLAAHFSEARDEDRVEVEYTPRRYVRKPHGSDPGRVVVTREKVLVLRRSEGVLRRLLDRELKR